MSVDREHDELYILASKLLKDRKVLLTYPESQADQILNAGCGILYGQYDVSLKSKFADIIYTIAFRDDQSLEKCWQIYWTLNRCFFLTPGLELSEGNLDELYGHIFDFIKSMTDENTRPFIPKEKRSNRVVVVASQFLGVDHAPTRRVLDYSYAIQHDLGMQVIIINDACLHYYLCPELGPGWVPTFADSYDQIDEISYLDEKFSFLQVSVLMPNIETIDNLANMIFSLKPAFVFNIGGSSLVADMCDDFTTVASLPCAYSLSVSRCSNLVLGRSLEGDVKAQADGADGNADRKLLPPGRGPVRPYQRVVETTYNFAIADPEVEYTREQFGIGDDDFVACVVGNRLAEEISSEFVTAVCDAISADSVQNEVNASKRTLKVVFIGPGVSKETVIPLMPEECRDRIWERFIFTGSLKGASAFLKISDLTLNPERLGGGRSAFEGFWYGKPSVTLRMGDVYWAGIREFGVDSWQEFSDRIVRLKNDTAFYEKMSKQARARAEEISDIANTQKKLLKDLEVIE